MKSTPARVAQISSCSTAAARNVSAAQMSGVWPPSLISRASLPTVVVLPVPLTPTIITTCGRWPLAGGTSVARRIARISALTSSRSDAPPRSRDLTASTMRSVAATPTSAEISASSSASIVSTSIGRLRCSGVSARRTTSSNFSTNCCFVLVRDCLMRSKKPMAVTCRPPPAVCDPSGRRRPLPVSGGPRAPRPSRR